MQKAKRLMVDLKGVGYSITTQRVLALHIIAAQKDINHDHTPHALQTSEVCIAVW